MSTTEQEGTQEGAAAETEEFTLAPAADLDDLFADEEPEDLEVEIPEDLSEDELRRRLVASERKAAFERTQRIQTARKTWIMEAKEHFPYSAPDKIKADSRRSFLEEAKRQDSDFRERAKPILDKVEKSEDEIRAEIRAELEKEAAAAFGRPTVGSGGSTEGAAQEETDKRLEKARRTRDLSGAARALMDARRI